MGDSTQQMWGMLGDKAKAGQFGGDPGAGQPNPQGQLMAMMEPVEKVLQQMVKMNDKMQPYVERALALLKIGLGQSMGTPAGVTSPQTQKEPMTPMSSRAPEGIATSFPGAT
jgi:hypothetical protein